MCGGGGAEFSRAVRLEWVVLIKEGAIPPRCLDFAERLFDASQGESRPSDEGFYCCIR